MSSPTTGPGSGAPATADSGNRRLATCKLSKSTKHFADLPASSDSSTYLHIAREREPSNATDIARIYIYIYFFTNAICIAANTDSQAGWAGQGYGELVLGWQGERGSWERGTFRIRKANELEIMRLKFKKRAIYVKNLSKQASHGQKIFN